MVFASLDRFRGSDNEAIRAIVTGFFDVHERAVIERALSAELD